MDIIEKLVEIKYISSTSVPVLMDLINEYDDKRKMWRSAIRVLETRCTDSHVPAAKARLRKRYTKASHILQRLGAELQLRVRLQDNVDAARVPQDLSKYTRAHQRNFHRRSAYFEQVTQQIGIMRTFAEASIADKCSEFGRTVPAELRQLIRGRMDEQERVYREMDRLRVRHSELEKTQIPMSKTTSKTRTAAARHPCPSDRKTHTYDNTQKKRRARKQTHTTIKTDYEAAEEQHLVRVEELCEAH